MKKLIIAAFAVAIAAVAQAATVTWTINGVATSNGTTANTHDAYLFAYTGTPTVTEATIVSVLTATYADKGASEVQKYLSDNSIYTLTASSAGVYTDTTTKPDAADLGLEGGKTYKFYAIFLDTDGITDSSMVAVSKVVSKAIPANSTNAGVLLGSQATYTTADKWTALGAIPEPTSGLLMLLGMGALALRRRRA